MVNQQDYRDADANDSNDIKSYRWLIAYCLQWVAYAVFLGLLLSEYSRPLELWIGLNIAVVVLSAIGGSQFASKFELQPNKIKKLTLTMLLYAATYLLFFGIVIFFALTT